MKFSFEAMGTNWEVTIWDDLNPEHFEKMKDAIILQSRKFDGYYSRFKKDSFVSLISHKTGVFDMSPDFISMLKLYQKFYALSGGKVNPLIGNTISDLGYDADYSLVPRKEIRPTPDLNKAVKIVDDLPKIGGRVEIREPVLFDFGALGKGFFVDKISDYLREENVKRFLVNGSGDVFYHGNGVAINAGLEHPDDPKKVIGSMLMTEGAMCASGINRRRWGNYHHIIDPHTKSSPQDILAVWVCASTTAVADGLATCLFLCEPENFRSDNKGEFQFEYCILNREMRVKCSPGFDAEFF